jgi:acyl-[acyl-carrier-protein] desaturase
VHCLNLKSADIDPVSLDRVRSEIEAEFPRSASPSLMSAEARARAIERGVLALYRWYTAHSQAHRNWHPDTCIDWRQIRRDHSTAVHTVVEGFFAVEQYTPDYVSPLIKILRRSYGRSQWHLRWGAEEERHADLWRNAVLALGQRNERWINDYTDILRTKEWCLPWESPLHMVFYQLIQERATQVSYLNLGLGASGRLPRLPTPRDDKLADICHIIAADEAAHYHFFCEIARLVLYYDAERALDAFVEVLRLFTMPGRDIIPDYDHFGEVLQAAGLFGKKIHYRDVVQVVLDSLSLPAVRTLEAGVRRLREIPDMEHGRRTSALLDTLNVRALEAKVHLLFERYQTHLSRAGLDQCFESSWERAWHLRRS